MRGAHTDWMHSHVYKNTFLLLFPSTTLSLCLSYTLNMIISLNYKLDEIKINIEPFGYRLELFFHYDDKIVREMY